MSEYLARRLEDALHGVRSSLAGVQAEAELLELDGVNVARLMQALERTLSRIATGEDLARTLHPRTSASRVVLLEDDEGVGTALVRRLGRAGYEACLVTRVESAIAWASTGALMIADLTALEGASSSQITDIRGARPVVITGATADEGKRRAQVFAPAAVLAKPINFAMLAASLDGHPASELG